MGKIKILAIPSDMHGVGKYRITSPYTHLQENYNEDFHIDIKMEVPEEDNFFLNYDIVIFHSFIHNKSSLDTNLKRIKWLQKKGIVTIMDIDDYWIPERTNPRYNTLIKNGIPQSKIAFLKNADYITTTTSILRNTILNTTGKKEVQIFPNAIDEKEEQFRPNPTSSERVRFGWLGGSGHKHDISLLRDGINNIYSNYLNKAQFVLCGFDVKGEITEINKITKEERTRKIKPKETTWYKYEQIFTNDYKVIDDDYFKFLNMFEEKPYNDLNKPYRRLWTKHISKYAFNYNQFDVSLAPLCDTKFNNNKSQLKIIEAGFHKKPIIASDSKPYQLDLINAYEKGGTFNSNGNALIVPHIKNHKEWGKHMKRLIESPNLREDLGNNLYETVKTNYSLEVVNKNRRDFLKSVV